MGEKQTDKDGCNLVYQNDNSKFLSKNETTSHGMLRNSQIGNSG